MCPIINNMNFIVILTDSHIVDETVNFSKPLHSLTDKCLKNSNYYCTKFNTIEPNILKLYHKVRTYKKSQKQLNILLYFDHNYDIAV